MTITANWSYPTSIRLALAVSQKSQTLVRVQGSKSRYL